MAVLNSVSIITRGAYEVCAFLNITSEAGGGWEVVTDAGGLLPEILGGLDFVRILVPAETQEEGPVAGINLTAEYAGAAGSEDWVDGGHHPAFQMLAGDQDPHVFFVEYGRVHSVPK
jgi:hypothetical protein